MTDARTKLQAKISEMALGELIVALIDIDGPWDTRSPEQHTLRAELLSAVEKRTDGKFVQYLIDEALEATKKVIGKDFGTVLDQAATARREAARRQESATALCIECHGPDGEHTSECTKAARTNYKVVTPEMGETIPEDTTVEARCSRQGGYYVKTVKVLTGRGIRSAGTTDIGSPKNCYHVTERAFDKLCKTENVTVISLLD